MKTGIQTLSPRKQGDSHFHGKPWIPHQVRNDSNRKDMKLPANWKWKKLREICEKPEYGYTTSAKFDGSGPLLLRTTDITNGNIDWQAVPYCAEPPTDEKRYSLKDGDILIARAGSVGASVVIKNPPRSVFASYLIRFRPKKELNASYAGFFLSSDIFRSQLGAKISGTTLPGVNATNLSNVQIPVPSLPTQRKIASILEKAESARERRKEANRLINEFLKSAFLEMFGDPVRNPKGWDKFKVTSLGKVQTGNTPSRKNSDNYGNYIEWIKSDNIINDEMFVSKSREMLSKEGFKKARFVESGSILVTCIAGSPTSIGNVALTNRKVTFNQQINAVKPYQDVNPIFLYGLFKMSKQLIQKSTTLGMKRIITKSKFENLVLIKPPLNLQQNFADLVQKVERLKEKQHESERELADLFNSLMQRAFTGKKGQATL